MVSKTILSTLLFLSSSFATPLFNLPNLNLNLKSNSLDENSNNLKYFKLAAQKLRGSNINNAVLGAEPILLEKRDDTGNYVTLDLINESTFYLAHIELGTPSQKVGVLVDTGSSDLWVVASNNTYCESGTSGSLNKKARADIVDWTVNNTMDASYQSPPLQNKASTSSSSSSDMIDCSKYGTFDFSTSETFHSNDTDFSITYADGTFAKGTWGYDDFVIGNTNVTNLSFAVCDEADNSMGILGIGLSGLETTYSGSTSSNSGPYKYENLPIKLKNEGIIDLVSYSIYLNDTSSNTADILFGAVDHNRYTGNLVALPIVNILSSKGYNSAIQLDITINSLTLINNSTSTGATIGSGAAAALLDTGTTLTYLPSDVLNGILNNLDAKYSSSAGYYIMTCSDADNYSLDFDFQGQVISIGLSSFLISLVTTTGSSSSYCMVGLQSSGDSTFTLGDSFLRNVYMVVDLENLEVGLATANYDSGESEDIEVMSTGIPNAVTPVNSMTWGASSSTALYVQSGVSMTAMGSKTSSASFQSKNASTATKKTTSSTSSSTSSSVTVTSSSENTSSDSTSSASSSSSSVSVSSISTTSKNNANSPKVNTAYGFTGSLFLIVAALI